jgi:hypothetical protein
MSLFVTKYFRTFMCYMNFYCQETVCQKVPLVLLRKKAKILFSPKGINHRNFWKGSICIFIRAEERSFVWKYQNFRQKNNLFMH